MSDPRKNQSYPLVGDPKSEGIRYPGVIIRFYPEGPWVFVHTNKAIQLVQDILLAVGDE